MSARRALLATLAALALLAALPAAASAAASWGAQALAAPTAFKPGDASGVATYESFFTNLGSEPTDETQITITDTLPEGVGVKSIELQPSRSNDPLPGSPCKVNPGPPVTVVCAVTNSLFPAKEPARLNPNEQLRLAVHVTVPLCPGGPEAACSLTNQVEVQGGNAGAATAAAHNGIDPECVLDRQCADAGFQEFHADLLDADGQPATAAASHPYQLSTAFAVNVVQAPPGAGQPFLAAGGDLRDIDVALPPGLAGNPTAAEPCPAQRFNTIHATFSPYLGEDVYPNECPDAAVVGVAIVQGLEGVGGGIRSPIYNLVPPKGMPAQLGFQVAGAPIYIDTKLRSDGDYGVTGYLRDTAQAKRITAARTSFWGVPSDPSHDTMRGKCLLLGGACEGGAAKPFLRLPSRCENPLLFTMSFLTWTRPPASATTTLTHPTPTDCAAPDFSPTILSRPTTNLADSPTGLHFDLHLPQAANEADVDGRGEADLRETTVTLPPGLVVNPAAADGLGACSPAQIGLLTPVGQQPPRFSDKPAECPDAAKVGRVEVKTPLLDHSLPGSVYLAQQFENPFNSLLALYIAVEDPQSGVVVKVAAKVAADPQSGQLTTTVSDSPEVPFEDFTFDFFPGARASLRTPPRCATHTTAAHLTPYSSPERAAVSTSDSFQIAAGPSGPCPSGALDPHLSAGLANPTAGAYSPFSLRLTRPDASQEFAALTAATPLGLVANLVGVPYCPEAAIALAASRTAPGQGALEQRSPSCPPASRVGSTTAGAGAGPSPFYTGGDLFLAGPYKGAPLSLVAIIPAVAGPFDLGVLTTRIAIRVDPETARVTTETDPLPRILAGIPLDVRDIRAVLDRPRFTLAPTSCEPQNLSATVFGVAGAAATVSDRFQVGGCEALGFKPKISLTLKGETRRGGNPALRSVVTYPQGAYANIARASIALPHSEFLDQAHIRTICTRVQFAAGACPAGSIYGHARAMTPLLDAPLEGPVYLRSSANPLPDMVFALHGQIDVAAVGRIDSHNGGIRVTFDAVPDAPLSKLVVNFPPGRKGLLENSRDICRHTNRATARLSAHNGRTYNTRPLLRAKGCKG